METAPTSNVEASSVPASVRRLVILSIAFLIISVALSGFNAYMTFAAPLRSTNYNVPHLVGFEGQLADSGGNPITGSKTLTFSLYNVATGGTTLWTETHTNVQVVNGLYSVRLGSVNPTGNPLTAAHFTDPRWLGITVSGDAEMSPRIPISSVPFALNAEQAMGLQGYAVSGAAPSSGQVLQWNGTSEWTPSTLNFSDLGPVGSNADPDDFFKHYRRGDVLVYVDTTSIQVTAGELMINGNLRANTTSITVTLSGGSPGSGPSYLGIEDRNGQPVANASADMRYNVYAVATSGESAFDIVLRSRVEADAAAVPSNYRLLGWFETATTASPIEVKAGSATNALQNASDAQFATGSYVGNGAGSREIYVGFRPYAVLVMSSGRIPLLHSGNQQTCWLGSPYTCYPAIAITGVSGTGFNINNQWNVNDSGGAYYWMAWGY